MLRTAIAANPDYAPTYLLLAGLLPDGPEARELREQGEYVARTRDQLYTENLIGPVLEARQDGGRAALNEQRLDWGRRREQKRQW